MAEIRMNPSSKIADDDLGIKANVRTIGADDRLLVQSSGGSYSNGTLIASPADVAVGVGATVPLPPPPALTRRMVVQVTSGDAATTVVRIRELGGAAGTGIILVRYGSRVYGGSDGSIASLEAEHIAGPATTVAVQFEEDW